MQWHYNEKVTGVKNLQCSDQRWSCFHSTEHCDSCICQILHKNFEKIVPLKIYKQWSNSNWQLFMKTLYSQWISESWTLKCPRLMWPVKHISLICKWQITTWHHEAFLEAWDWQYQYQQLYCRGSIKVKHKIVVVVMCKISNC